MPVRYNKSSLFNRGLKKIARGLKRRPRLSSFARRYNRWRHGRIQREILPILEAARAETLDSSSGRIALGGGSPVIWMLWWQGEDSAPDLVRCCIESVRRFSGGMDVIVIDKFNLSTYINLPNAIKERLDEGSMSLAHFSDFVRFSLLAQYGGLWMDATLYATGPIDADVHGSVIYTCGTYADPTLYCVSDCRWTLFYIGGEAGNSLFRFMSAFLARYWEENSEVIDYLLTDYGLNYAYEWNIGGFADACEKARGRNPHLHDLTPLLNCPYDAAVWDELTHDTHVFKLSYKFPLQPRPGTFADVIGVLGKTVGR